VGKVCRKKGFGYGMKERVGDEKLIIISVAVKGIHCHNSTVSTSIARKQRKWYLGLF